MMVNLTVPVAHADQAVAVPISAVFKGQNESRVVYVLQENKTHERVVTLGVSSLDYTEIKSGLKIGERILSVEPRVLEKKL